VEDPHDDSDYAVAVVGRRPFGDRSRVRDVGPLRLAIAEVDVDGIATLVVALNPMATVDPGGFDTWKQQIEALASVVPTLPGPLVVVGDLNTTQYRPEFEALLQGRLNDAIDDLGKGLTTSFKLSAKGPLATVGAVARLDHALVDDRVHALAMEQLLPCGSDHLPLRLTFAIRPR
jgi:endonuclease/exonuclease/phosphatase (EEP) superfamily protein YafD